MLSRDLEFKQVRLPSTGTVRDVTLNVPIPLRRQHQDRWTDVVEQILEANTFDGDKGIRDAKTDVLFIR